MIIKSLIAAFFIYILSNFLFKKKLLDTKYVEHPRAKLVIGLFSLLFLLLFYVLPVSYYFPHNNGVLGDNYLHMYWALTTPGFIKPHHPLFPLIPEKFIRVLIGTGVLSTDDPMFLEKAFYWSVFPVSLGMILGIAAFSHAIFKKGTSNLMWIAIFLLFATSYGLWIWGIQSNAIGLSLAMELLVGTTFLYWYKTRTNFWLLLLAILMGTSIFLYNGLIYLAIGTYISFSWVVIKTKGFSTSSKLRELFFFSAILLVMAGAYYLFEASVNHTYNLSKIFSKISETEYLGAFGDSNILSSIESNFWSGINWIVGFYYTSKYNYWEPIQSQVTLPIGSNWIKAFQMGALFSLIIAIGVNYVKKRQGVSRDLFVFGLINSIIFFLGFTLRMAGTHYYVLALVPNLFLLTSFLIGEGERKNRIFYIVPIVVIVLGSFYFNSFTRLSVFEGRNINDHPYYFENISILNITKGRDATYFKKMDLEYYPNMTLKTYYKDKFESTQWVTSWSGKSDLEEKIMENSKKQREVFLSKEAADLVNHSKYITKKLNNDLYLLSSIANP